MKTVGAHAATCVIISATAIGQVAPGTRPGSHASGSIDNASAANAAFR